MISAVGPCVTQRSFEPEGSLRHSGGTLPGSIPEDDMKRLCGECGKRAVEPVAASGRRSPFRNFPELEVPSTLAIPTCSNCGAEWIDHETAKQIDEVLAAKGAAVLADVARQAIEALAATMSHAGDEGDGSKKS